MKKEFGILALLLALCAAVAFMNPRFLLAINLENTTALIGMYGIFSIGLGLVIITGGIDLSVGSLFALQGVILGILLNEWGWTWWIVALILLLGTMALGLLNGLLITRAKMQPFIVTLCGLLIYRGAARFVSGDRSVGFGQENYGILRSLQAYKLPGIAVPFLLLGGLVLLLVLAGVWFTRRRRTRDDLSPGGGGAGVSPLAATLLVGLALYAILTIALLVGFFAVSAVNPSDIDTYSKVGAVFSLLATERYATPMPVVLLLATAVVVGVVLHGSVYGRYLYAVGRNEEATRYSGVNTKRVITAAYVISAALAAVSGLLFAFYANAITPASHGSFYELFGIAAAVLGGCSLRGGEGSVFGIVLGAALIQVLQNFVNLLGLPSSLNFAVMGGVILIGVLADQFLSGRKGRKGKAIESGFEVLGPETVAQAPAGTGSAKPATAAD